MSVCTLRGDAQISCLPSPPKRRPLRAVLAVKRPRAAEGESPAPSRRLEATRGSKGCFSDVFIIRALLF